ncbi:MAG: hypothetical protein DMG66_00750 [Acidobacteria bacterium]|nr:MAG: hypothetical protein DMG66_00750 [Acidobacteriota bacterium]
MGSMLTTWPAPLPVTQQVPLPLRAMGLMLAASSPLWLWALFHASAMYTTSAGPFVVLLIGLANVPLLLQVTRRDPYLRVVMAVGMLAKLAAASLYLYMAFRVYDTASDALNYFYEGSVYAYDVNSVAGWQLLHPFWSNNFIYMLAGAAQVFLGSSLQAVTILFAVASFWGEYLFYRAFCTAAPNGDHRLAAAGFFLLPSIVFWPACIGKDAVVLLFLGGATRAFAIVSHRLAPLSVAALFLAGAGVMLVRPHIALMLAISLLLPLLVSRNRRGLLGILSRFVAAPLLLLGTLYLASAAQKFLEVENVAQGTSLVRRVGASNYLGGSAFQGHASLGSRVLAAPVLFFRPFPWEIHSAQALIAASEGLLLAFLVWKRRRELLLALRASRETAVILAAILFVAQFSIIFSAAITNFGLLARERVMAMPFLVLLLCFHKTPAARAWRPASAANPSVLATAAGTRWP